MMEGETQQFYHYTRNRINKTINVIIIFGGRICSRQVARSNVLHATRVPHITCMEALLLTHYYLLQRLMEGTFMGWHECTDLWVYV